MNVSICADLDSFELNFDKGNNFMLECCAELDAKKKNAVMLAFEELYVNILKYNDGNNDLVVDIKAERRENTFIVTMKDNGIRFNPLEREEPSLENDAMDREVGGLGIFLSRKFTDFIRYKYECGQNVISFGVVL